MSEWKDTTSYGRGGPKPGEEPSAWQITLGTMRVVVTRHINHDPADWIMRCDEIGLGLFPLASRDIEAAKREALERVLMRGQAIVARVSKMLGA